MPLRASRPNPVARYWCLLLPLMAAVLIPAMAAAGQPTLAARIDADIGQARFMHADWGIAVVSLDSGRTVYAHNADRLMQPASTAKLFTAALVLGTLDPGGRIPTRVLAGPLSRHGRLDGPLILYGMGDPTLGATAGSADWADQLARQLVARGFRRIDGDLIADDRYFAGPSTGDGWEAGDLQDAFAAPASALSVDENKVVAYVSAAGSAGQPAHLRLDPAAAMASVSERLVTSAAGTPDDLNLYRAPGGSTLYAFGSIAADSAPRHVPLAVPDPAALAGHQLAAALARAGIRWSSQLRTLHWPQDDDTLRAGTQVVAEVRSPPLRGILQQGLKRSQNLYLQNLLQLAGVRARVDASPSSDTPPAFRSDQAWGLQALRMLLARIDVPDAAVMLSEGTGLSRRDLSTPNALLRVLVYLAAQTNLDGADQLLPVAGVDGTLAHRLRGTPAAGNLRAKTGSMTYVNCLAGYVTSAAGEHLAFVIMLNNYAAPANAPAASTEVDALAAMLAGWDARD